ncbi:MAG: hypothetical protein L0Z62_34630 [Gemmataceae bacterium]|nr:hypothetical protein [Gemmataceae bacterium]
MPAPVGPTRPRAAHALPAGAASEGQAQAHPRRAGDAAPPPADPLAGAEAKIGVRAALTDISRMSIASTSSGAPLATTALARRYSPVLPKPALRAAVSRVSSPV